MNRQLFSLLALVAVASILIAACGPQPGQSPAATQPPAVTPAPPATQAPAGGTQAPAGTSSAAEAEAVLNSKCTQCHDLTRVINAKHDAAGWKQTIDRMINTNGAKVTPEEENLLNPYLASKYHP
jgi:cytochrome c5